MEICHIKFNFLCLCVNVISYNVSELKNLSLSDFQIPMSLQPNVICALDFSNYEFSYTIILKL